MPPTDTEGWPWTWLARGGPYTQRDPEKGTIEAAPKVELQEPLSLKAVSQDRPTGLTSSRLHHHERQGEIQTPELENPK